MESDSIILSSCSCHATFNHRPTHCTSLSSAAVRQRTLLQEPRVRVTSHEVNSIPPMRVKYLGLGWSHNTLLLVRKKKVDVFLLHFVTEFVCPVPRSPTTEAKWNNLTYWIRSNNCTMTACVAKLLVAHRMFHSLLKAEWWCTGLQALGCPENSQPFTGSLPSSPEIATVPSHVDPVHICARCFFRECKQTVLEETSRRSYTSWAIEK